MSTWRVWRLAALRISLFVNAALERSFFRRRRPVANLDELTRQRSFACSTAPELGKPATRCGNVTLTWVLLREKTRPSENDATTTIKKITPEIKVSCPVVYGDDRAPWLLLMLRTVR